MFSSLPLDVQLEILQFLDLTSIVRFCSINRRWNSFLKSSSSAPIHRSFEPPGDLLDDPKLQGLIRWLECSKRIIDHLGGWHALRIPQKLMSTSSALSLVKSSPRLTRIDLFLDGQLFRDVSHVGDMLVSQDRGALWTQMCRETQQKTDEVVDCILHSCPELKELKLSSDYDFLGSDSHLSCRLFRVPPDVSTRLRSLELHDIRPRIDQAFLNLIEQAETFIVRGPALLCEQAPTLTALSLRLILRCLEKGGRLETFISEQRMVPDGQQPHVLFEGLASGLIKASEVDSRWPTVEKARQAAVDELVREFVCDSSGRDYGNPAPIRLDRLKTFHIKNSASALRFHTGDSTDTRDNEVARIRAPNLETLLISCTSAKAVVPIFKSARNLKNFHLQCADAKMELLEVLQIFRAAPPSVETLEITFSYASWYYIQHNLDFRQKDVIEKLAEVDRSGQWLLPNLTTLQGVENQKEVGPALLWLVEQRRQHSALRLSCTPTSPEDLGRQAVPCKRLLAVVCYTSNSIHDRDDERIGSKDLECLEGLLDKFSIKK